MKNVRDIKEFKETKKIKVYVEHLKAITKVVDLSIAGLKHFEVYIPVHRILRTLKDEKKILDSHLANYEKILKERK